MERGLNPSCVLVRLLAVAACDGTSNARVGELIGDSAVRIDEEIRLLDDELFDWLDQRENLAELWKQHDVALCAEVTAARDAGYCDDEIREAIEVTLQESWGMLNAGTRSEIKGRVRRC